MYHAVGSPIPELTFGTPHQILNEGTTLPLLFQMEQGGKAGGAWVVKAAKRRPSAMLVELACSELCAHFGILTPAVGVALFDDDMPDYDDSEVGRAARRTHEEHRGDMAFCSRHLEGATRLTPDNLKWSRPGVAEQALRLFLFDVLVWHGDRSTTTPNALWFHRQIVAIDHGRAMYNLESTDDAGLGPDLSLTLSQDRWDEHIAFRRLCRAWKKGDDSPALEAALDSFAQRVAALDDVAIKQMSARWPPGLDKGGMRGDIERFLRARRMHYPALEIQVRNALANC
jgi:hypothetical protein